MPTLTYAQAINQALREELRADPRVFLMGEDIGHHGGVFRVTKDLVEEFGPERVRDTPISESGFTGVGIGAALAGMRPVVELLFIDFALVAADQIVNQAAKLRYMSGGQVSVPIVIRGQQGGGRGNGAQHSQSFESWFAQTPGLKVVAPATPYDAKGLLKSAIRDDDPVVFIEGEMLYNMKGDVPEDEYVIPLGSAEVKRAGTDVTIVCHSKTVAVALKAAEQLAGEGVSAEVLDLRTIRPLDTATVLGSVARTHRCVVAEEGWPFAGVGAQVVDVIQREVFDELDAPVLRVTGADVPMPYNRHLEKAAKVDAGKLVDAVGKVLYR
jgi:pyruvate/2-oxoglutarate/acetoin dehydrogenase E1 component